MWFKILGNTETTDLDGLLEIYQRLKNTGYYWRIDKNNNILLDIRKFPRYLKMNTGDFYKILGSEIISDTSGDPITEIKILYCKETGRFSVYPVKLMEIPDNKLFSFEDSKDYNISIQRVSESKKYVESLMHEKSNVWTSEEF